jgi:hypothetical protein
VVRSIRLRIKEMVSVVEQGPYELGRMDAD